MPADRFTAEEKLTAARREVLQRKRVYPRLIETGSMTPEKAKFETEIMDAIAADYEKLAAGERLL